MKIDLILAEFGSKRQTAGDAALPSDRLEPALSSFRKYFDLNAILYTDTPMRSRGGVDIRVVNPPFVRTHPRYGWRCNDYYKLYGLRQSTADVAISTDADMLAVADEVKSLVPMALKFGLLAPPNGRLLVRRDMKAECDGSPVNDESLGMGYAYNGTPYVLGKRTDAVLELIDAYLDEMRVRPCRGPVAMWRAVWRTGTYPYLLPPQFCLCARHVADPDVIFPALAHVGHEAVRKRFMPDA